MKPKNRFRLLVVFSCLALPAQAANLIVNGDFETHSNTNNTAFVDPGGNWTNTGLTHYNDDDFGTGKYLYSWTPGSLHQTVSAPWTTSDIFEIALTTVVPSWGSETTNNVFVELRNTSDVVLWTSNTVDVTKSPVLYPSWSVAANSLAATAGENLNLRIVVTGPGTAIDDVSLTIVPIPEPSTVLLGGLSLLALLRRRR